MSEFDAKRIIFGRACGGSIGYKLFNGNGGVEVVQCYGCEEFYS